MESVSNRIRRAHTLSSRGTHSRTLNFETLEDRRLLSTVTIDTHFDIVDFNDGVTSLREAIFATNLVGGTDTILFDPALAGETILLTQGELLITDSLMINGLGADQLTIDASGNDPTPDINDGLGTRIFNIDDGNGIVDLNVGVARLTLTGEDSSSVGGAIFLQDNLLLYDAAIVSNYFSSGGGIYINFDANVTIADSSILNNSSSGNGGGMRALGLTTITNSTISGNSGRAGGGILTRLDTVITNSTI